MHLDLRLKSVLQSCLTISQRHSKLTLLLTTITTRSQPPIHDSHLFGYASASTLFFFGLFTSSEHKYSFVRSAINSTRFGKGYSNPYGSHSCSSTAPTIPNVMSSTPPAGIDLHADKGPRVAYSGITLIVLPTLFVILRFISRAIARAGFWWGMHICGSPFFILYQSLRGKA